MERAGMNLDDEFKEFIAKVYPDPPAEDSDQWRQLRDAFFAGCVLVYGTGFDLSAQLHSHYARVLEHLQGDGRVGEG